MRIPASILLVLALSTQYAIAEDARTPPRIARAQVRQPDARVAGLASARRLYRADFFTLREPDPYEATDAPTLLCEFRDYWNEEVTLARDVAHLMTGRELDGTTVGLSFSGAVCGEIFNFEDCTIPLGPLDYGLSESYYAGLKTPMAQRVGLTAHELGHSWSACHCNTASCTGGDADPDCGIMFSIIGPSDQFGSRSVSSITAHRDTRTCLDVCQCTSTGNCDDGMPCTLNTCDPENPDADDSGCVFVPVDCSAAGDDCNTAACSDTGPKGNCAAFSPINEGGACNGDAGSCTVGICVPDVACDAIADCADRDGNGMRDNGCVYWACEAETCLGTAVPYADMGGANGACTVDGTADANDRFHALNCFSDLATSGDVGYPCEETPPAAFNVDAAGLGAACVPDGVCDGNDAFAAINAFAGLTTCVCPGASGPMPSAGHALVVERAVIELRPLLARPTSGSNFEVDVMLASPLADLRGYQLHLGTSAGLRGGLQLVDIYVAERADRVLAQLETWEAFNVSTGQMVIGSDAHGGSTAGGYLATFVYRARPDASGSFAVELRHDPGDPTHRTVLFPTSPQRQISVESASAIIEVDRLRDSDNSR